MSYSKELGDAYIHPKKMVLGLHLNLLIRTTIVGLLAALALFGSSVALGQEPLAESPPSTAAADLDADFVRAAVKIGCRGHHPTPEMVREMLAMERKAGFPPEARGLSIAAACNESGFHSHSKGDWRHEITRGKCSRAQVKAGECYFTSAGMMQFGGWVKKELRKMGAKTRDPRFDWRVSVQFWVKHIAVQVPRVLEMCPTLKKGWTKASTLDVWRAAHRTAIVQPLCIRYRRNGTCKERGPRCHRLNRHYYSAHWSKLDRWNEVAKQTAGTDGKKPQMVVWQDEKGNPIPRAVNP